MTDFLIAIAATAYLAYVITHTDGIGGSFARLRDRDRIGVTACIWCTSPWVALAVIGVLRFGEPFAVRWLVEALAAAGVAMGFLSWTGAKHL